MLQDTLVVIIISTIGSNFLSTVICELFFLIIKINTNPTYPNQGIWNYILYALTRGQAPQTPLTRVSRVMCYSEIWKFG